MEAFRAPWVIPVSTPPITDGVVVVEGETIAGIGPARDLLPHLDSTPVTELPNHAVLPGLVNAHTHLALTRERNRHPRGKGLFAWLESIVPAILSATPEDRATATREGLDLAYASGTALLGEILSGPIRLESLREDHRIAKRIFLEVSGLDREKGRRRAKEVSAVLASEAGASHWKLGVSPHAPYSLHRSLWEEVVRVAREQGVPWTSHIGESPEERRYLERGGGAVEHFLESLAIVEEHRIPWRIPAVAALQAEDLLDGLLVHGVDLTPGEMDLLALEDTPLCLCPGSNAWLGLPPPQVAELVQRGVFLCLGTDSLASNDALSIWAEMRRIRSLAPGVPAVQILKMATANGAIALGFSGLAGSLHPGSSSRILAVELGAEGIRDPLEYLVRAPAEGHLTHLGPWSKTA